MHSTHSPVRSLGLLALVILGAGCAADVGEGSGGLLETDRCRISGDGLLASGEVLGGLVEGNEVGVSGAWTHAATDGSVLFGDADWIFCRINGATFGDFEGSAVFGGVPGHRYRVAVQDRGSLGGGEIVPGPPESRFLAAQKRYRPTVFEDGAVDFADRARVRVPSSLPVTVGNAGNQWAWLTFDSVEGADEVVCRYRGGAASPLPSEPADLAAGAAYHFERCTGGDDAGAIAPGDELETSGVSLRVQNGAHMLPAFDEARTRVELELDVVPLTERPSEPDFYRILIWGPGGEVVYSVDGVLAAGDLRVDLL